MRRRSAVTTAALVLAATTGLACAIEIPTAAPDETPAPAPVTAEPGPTGSGTIDLEDKYDSYDDMDEYVDEVVRGFMYPWLRDTWPGMRQPDVRFVESGERGREGCLDYDGDQAYYTSESYEYCQPDLTVYLGQDTVWEFFRLTGDAGPAIGIAHEFGHHIQYQLGVDPPYTAAESVDFENQADCLAGVFTGWARDNDYLDDEDNDDLEDIEALFPLIASAEGDDRDHGTLQERRAAFYDGYDNGVRGCGLRAG